MSRKINDPITALISELKGFIEEYDRTQNQAQLAIRLSEKITEGEFTGTTRLYQLMKALNHAAWKDSKEDVAALANTVNTLVEKCDGNLLALSLSTVYRTGTNSWYPLMSALEEAARHHNQENVIKISDVAKTLIAKCEPVSLADGLFAGYDIYTGWRKLSFAAIVDHVNGSRSVASSVFFPILDKLNELGSSQITDRWKQMFVEQKWRLSPPLQQYLKNKAQTMSVAEFETMCSSSKLLGALIDHHRWFGEGKTTTRKFVDHLIEQKLAVLARAETRTTSTDAQLSNAISASPVLSDTLNTQISTEPPPPSYEQALQIIIAEKRRAKISVLKAAEALFEKLSAKLPCTTELRALDTAKSKAKKSGYDFEADESVREIRENIRQKIERLQTSIVPQSVASPVRFFASNATAQQVRRSPEQIREAQIQEERARALEQVRVPTPTTMLRT